MQYRLSPARYSELTNRISAATGSEPAGPASDDLAANGSRAALAPALMLPFADKLRATAGNSTLMAEKTYLWVHRFALRLPMSVEDIHKGSLGPLWHFTMSLKEQLCTVASLQEARFVLLGLRSGNLNITLGMYVNKTKTSQSALLLEIGVEGIDSTVVDRALGDPDALLGTETIVDFEVLPERTDEDTPTPAVFGEWVAELSDPESKLRKGSLALVLDGATIVEVGHSPPSSAVSVHCLRELWLFMLSIPLILSIAQD